jgi:hypothetical protein
VTAFARKPRRLDAARATIFFDKDGLSLPVGEMDNAQCMIRKSGNRFSEKIMLKQQAKAT